MELVFQYPGAIVRHIGNNTLRGTAVVYHSPDDPGTECQPPELHGGYERIARGAIPNDINERDVTCTYCHKEIIGRTGGNLRLMPMPHGLDYEITLNTSRGRDIIQEVDDKIIRGASFVAVPGYSTISRDGPRRITTIRSFESFSEISLSIFPYYTATNVIHRDRQLPNIGDKAKWLAMLEAEQEQLEISKRLLDIAANL